MSTDLKDEETYVEERIDREIAQNLEHEHETPDETPVADDDYSGDEGGQPTPKETGEIPSDLQARAQSAGFTPEQIARFQESGHLEEMLTAFDQRLLQQFAKPQQQQGFQQPQWEQPQQPQPQQPQPFPTQQFPGQQQQQPGTYSPQQQAQVPTPLDADVHGSDLVARDMWHQQRVDALSQQLSQLGQQLDQAYGMIAQRESEDYAQWFDDAIDAMEIPELFGKGRLEDQPPNSAFAMNRLQASNAYTQMQMLLSQMGQRVGRFDKSVLKRAAYAQFASEIERAKGAKIGGMLRDASGRFVSPSPGSGQVPRAPMEQTEDEIDAGILRDFKQKHNR